MVNPTPRLRRTFVVLNLAVLAVFGGLVLGLTLKLRGRLRAEVLRREAEAIHAVALMQLSSAQPREGAQDVFAAVLESSRLRGVLTVQLFDPTGTLRAALPRIDEVRTSDVRWWGNSPGEPMARFVPDGSLEDLYGLETEPNREPTRVPLLDVAVPIGFGKNDLGSLGVARYWIDGGPVATEFRVMDRGLIGQASFAFLGGGLLVTLALAWAFRRLENAHRQLREQSADLVRANQELDFAAKTSALGTISAHLIHGLKNPLAGLESFVADGASANDDDSGEAWKTAKETAVRLRAMVDEVVTVLGDEATGGGDHEVPSPEIINAAKARTADKARKAGIEISIVPGSDGMVTGRVANLVGLVLANLIGNAVEASAHGQRITVEARPNGSDVEFLVSDTGSGLPDNVRVNLFRPVRSSKAGGSGMGLAISHRLAKHAGGKLELIRTDRNGTAFRLLVPALER